MMSQLPLITIGITCYNAEETIEMAIKSALNQEYSNFEILVVDDVSSDRSRERIEEIQKKSKQQIKLIKHHKNLGVAEARNTIIKNAKGEFIVFFDDDDVSHPNRINIQYKKIISSEDKFNTDLIACWASGKKIYDNGYEVPFAAIGSREKIPQGQHVINYQLFMDREKNVFFGSGTPSCSLMIKRSLYDRIGLYDPKMRRIEDTDFALRLAEQGGVFVGCSEPLVTQFASIGADKRPDIGFQADIDLITKHKSLFDSPKRYAYAYDWSKFKYYHFSKKYFRAIFAFMQLLFKYPEWTIFQFARSVPKRIIHEIKMNRTANI